MSLLLQWFHVVYLYSYADLKENLRHLEQAIQRDKIEAPSAKVKELEEAHTKLLEAQENLKKIEQKLGELENQLRNEAEPSPKPDEVIQKDSLLKEYLKESNKKYDEAQRLYQKAKTLENFKVKEKELEP